MRYLLFLSVVLLASSANAQQWNWAADAGGGGNTDFCWAIGTDSQGNAYWAGSVSGTADFGCATLTPGSTIAGFVAKVDANGACQWVRGITTGFYDAWVYSIAIDAQDRIYITGSCQGSADFGNGIVLSGSGSTDDWFTARYDVDGTCIWAKRITNSSSSSEGRGIAVDEQGDIYVTGWANGSGYTFDPITVNTGGFNRQAVIVKYDSTGTALWAKSTTGTGTVKSARAIAVAGDRLFITGQIGYTPSFFGGISITPESSLNLYVLACDLDGNGLWARSYGNGDHEGFGIAADTLGNLFVAGRMWGDLFLPNDTLTSASSNDDMLIMGLSQEGEYRWAQRAGSTQRDIGWDVVADGLGNAYVSTHFQQSISFFGLPFTALGSEDALISKIEADGDLVWAKRASGFLRDIPLCIHRQSAAPHKLYFGGYYFGPITYGGSTLNDMGNGDAMIVSGIDTTFDVSSIATDVCPGACDGTIEPYVNGVAPFTFQWNNGSTMPELDGLCPGMYIVEVTDANGQVIIDTIYIEEHPDPGYTVQVLNDSLWTTGGNAWQWFFNGSTLVSDSASAIAAQTGEYHALVTDAYACTWSTDTVTVVLNTNVMATTSSFLRVYPVPTSSTLFVDRLGAAVQAELLNSSGQRVLNFNLRAGRNALDVEALPSGIYLLRTVDGSTVRVVRE
ncbi:MAG TPA: SBBP repeat-containing protein [Flavobacteriales bacterium]|nr:SBBP repeat-containing protein [Flavobacteriales bacterium]